MLMPAITHQKHHAQSGRSTQSAVDIFNTLHVFTKEPIREQEIKLECMNMCQYCMPAFHLNIFTCAVFSCKLKPYAN